MTLLAVLTGVNLGLGIVNLIMTKNNVKVYYNNKEMFEGNLELLRMLQTKQP